MAIWSLEIKELEILNQSLKGHFPDVEKDLHRKMNLPEEVSI